MRLHLVLPLLIPRLCQETCDIGGFEVVKGTKVMWAVTRSIYDGAHKIMTSNIC